MSLESARVLDDAAATATIVDGTTTFDFAASSPGTFRVDFTVTDGVTRRHGHRADHGACRRMRRRSSRPRRSSRSCIRRRTPPSTSSRWSPIPTRRVLLLSDVVGARRMPAPSLSVDAVGQSNLRVSGTTASGGLGRLGTVSYVVSDGTEDRGARVEGEATVYLLPPAPELAPIAVDDTVVVRAGAQIDIPVLENDLSPAGGRPTLNPASIASSSRGRARVRVGRRAALPRADRAGRVRHRLLGVHDGRAVARRHRDGARARARRRRQPRARRPRRSRAAC